MAVTSTRGEILAAGSALGLHETLIDQAQFGVPAAGNPAPTVVGTDTFGTGSGVGVTAFSGMSDQATIPAGAQADDVAVLVLGATDPLCDPTLSTPGGAWVKLDRLVPNSSSGSIWARKLTAGDVGQVVSSTTFSGTRVWGALVVLRGADYAALVASSPGNLQNSTGATDPVAPSLAFSSTSEVLGLYMAFDKGATPDVSWGTMPAGVTQLVAAVATPTGAGSAVIARRTAALTSSPVPSVTFDKTANYQSGAWTVALPGAPVSGGTPGTVAHIETAPLSGTSLSVTAKVAGFTTAELVVSTNSGLTSPTYFTGSVDSDGWFRGTATGLTAGTLYYVGVADTPSGGTRTVVSETGKVRTLRTGQTNFTFAVGSCTSNNATDGLAHTDVASWAPDFLLHLGDFHYRNPTETTVGPHLGYREAQVVGATGLKTMLRDVPSFQVQSDHDDGPGDNLDSTGSSTVAAIAAFEKYAPQQPALADVRTPKRGRYFSFMQGRVRFIVLDVRTLDRSPGLDPQSPSKTMLGATQKAWVKAQLLEAEPVKVIVSDVAWMGPTSPDANLEANAQDKWWAYGHERQELADFITTNNVRVLLVHGDSHLLGAGTRSSNTWGGFPVWCCSPFANVGGGRYTTYFDNASYNTLTSRGSQYGRMTVTDAGSSISIQFVGRDSTNATDRFAVTESWDLSLPITASGSATTSGSASLGVSTTVTGSGQTTTTGSVALAANLTLSASGSTTTMGSVAVTARTTLAGSGSTTTDGTAALGVRHGLTAAGTTTTAGAGALRVVHGLTGAGAATTDGAAGLTSTRRLTASGSTTTAGNAGLDIDGPGPSTLAVTASGTTTTTGSATVTLRAALTGSGATTTDGAATISRRTTLTGTGATTTAGSATLGAKLSLTASAVTSFSGAAQLTAALLVTAAGHATTTGSAVLSGDLDLEPPPVQRRFPASIGRRRFPATMTPDRYPASIREVAS